MLKELTKEDMDAIKAELAQRVEDGTYDSMDNDPDNIIIHGILKIASRHYHGEYTMVNKITTDEAGNKYIELVFGESLLWSDTMPNALIEDRIGAMLKDRTAEVFNAINGTGLKASLVLPYRYQLSGHFELLVKMWLPKQEG